MKHFNFFLLIVIIFFSLTSYKLHAQRWKQDRNSIMGGIGMSHFMGDLGGGKKDAAHFFGVRDLDFVTTRPVFTVGYRYRITEIFSYKVNLTYALIAARDEASGSYGRNLRNLSFRSHLWQLSANLEYSFVKEKEAPRYSFNSLSSLRNLSAYVFTGFGAFYFNPKTKYNKKWVALRPLHTEGQGYNVTYYLNPSMLHDYAGNITLVPNTPGYTVKITTPPIYKRIAWSFPIGLGARYNINRKMAIGLEIMNCYTTSDYIDDASDRYFNFEQMKNMGAITEYPELAPILADRHLVYDANEELIDGQPYLTGKTKRGDPSYNDAFILTVVSFHYKINAIFMRKPKFY